MAQATNLPNFPTTNKVQIQYKGEIDSLSSIYNDDDDDQFVCPFLLFLISSNPALSLHHYHYPIEPAGVVHLNLLNNN